MWQIWQFFMAKIANFCGKIWQNLGFQMAIFCDASLTTAVCIATLLCLCTSLPLSEPLSFSAFTVICQLGMSRRQEPAI